MEKKVRCVMCGITESILGDDEGDVECVLLMRRRWDYREANDIGPKDGKDIVKNWYCPDCKKQIT